MRRSSAPWLKFFTESISFPSGPRSGYGRLGRRSEWYWLYSQIGAQFGYGMLWTMVVSYPLMSAFQEICARIGRVTGHGIANNVRLRHPRLLNGIVTLVVLANVFNLGADIQAMDAALRLILPGPVGLYGSLLAALSVTAHRLRGGGRFFCSPLELLEQVY